MWRRVTTTTAAPNTILLVSFCVLEFPALLAALAIYKKSDRSLLVFLARPAGFVFLIAFTGLAISTVAILRQLKRNRPPGNQRFAVIPILNLGS